MTGAQEGFEQGFLPQGLYFSSCSARLQKGRRVHFLYFWRHQVGVRDL